MSRRFVEAGTDHITFHIEVVDEPAELIERLHELGVSAGVCLNPETPVEAVEAVAGLCDMVLVMTVHPGFGGQEFMPEAAKKIVRIRELVGPDTLVAGNAIFSKTDRIGAIKAIVEAEK